MMRFRTSGGLVCFQAQLCKREKLLLYDLDVEKVDFIDIFYFLLMVKIRPTRNIAFQSSLGFLRHPSFCINDIVLHGQKLQLKLILVK